MRGNIFVMHCIGAVKAAETFLFGLCVYGCLVICNALALYAYVAHFTAVYDCVVCLAAGS